MSLQAVIFDLDGVITDTVRAKLAQLAKAYPTKSFVVDSRVRLGEFEQVIIKPNIHAAQAALQFCYHRTIAPSN